ncbi:MAG: helix-turn-helix transcriptional regulator [Azospirillum sp.]|mgnify:FL=1|nr:helix-turn-helix transcriptional regulator [Azospirillum sp.]
MKDPQKSLTEIVLEVIGDRWKVKIVENLLNGTKRFGELKKSLGDITQKVLTSNLRKLEERGVLIRKVYAQIPPKVEYKLTAIGQKLKPTIDSMLEWGAEYRSKMNNLSKKIFSSENEEDSENKAEEKKNEN